MEKKRIKGWEVDLLVVLVCMTLREVDNANIWRVKRESNIVVIGFKHSSRKEYLVVLRMAFGGSARECNGRY